MIHESAFVEDAIIGEGTKIWHFAHVRKGAKIGKNCNIGKDVYIDTNVEIGDNCKIQNFASIYRSHKNHQMKKIKYETSIYYNN